MAVRGTLKLAKFCTRGYTFAKFRRLHTYPINIFTNQYRDVIVKLIDQIDEFGKNGNWSELIEILTLFPMLIDSTQLAVQNEDQPPPLFTSLHYAASRGAPQNTFERLIELGSAKCLKTAAGNNAYDIARTKKITPNILQLLEIPNEIKQNSNEIDTMEKALHTLILGRVEYLIRDNGQVLPQLAFLYEKGEFHYPVSRMYGGFNVSKHDKGIQIYSFNRVVGGSEQTHVIDRQGKVALVSSG